MNQKPKVIIIGAGPGGLTAGMELAHRGVDVTIFEKNKEVGGRNAAIRRDGYVFDTGPTFLMMKFILDEVFKDVGRKSEDYLEFIKLDPMYRLIFNDLTLDISSDHKKLKKEIARVFPGEDKNVDKFFRKEKERFEKIYPCLRKDYNSWKEFFVPVFLKAIPYIPLGQSIFDYLGNYFDSEKLRLAFTFQSKYLGMAVTECPAFFVIIPYLEHQFGIYHVRGGLSEISEAMARVVREDGGKIKLNTPVKQLILDGKKVVGVKLENGRKMMADAIIINADFGYAMNKLVPRRAVKKWSPENLKKKKFSCSTFMLYLGVDKMYPEMAHHTIVFAEDYHKNVREVFKGNKVSEDMSFYIRNSSILDDKAAPRGKSNIYVLVPMPNNRSRINWKRIEKSYRDKVIKKIMERTEMKDLDKHIESELIISPRWWEKEGNVYEGATFNLAHNLSQMLYFRPHNEFEELENCYLVGGGTHPGSGLPTIYQSGRISSDLILKKFCK